MTAGSPVVSDTFDLKLRPFRIRAMRLGFGRVVLFSAAVLLIAFVVAMWLDLIWALPPTARWAITRIGPLVATIITISLIVWRAAKITEERVARQIDASQRTGGEILAGWQLATRPVQPNSELSLSLAHAAATKAGIRMSQIDPSQVIANDMVKKAAIFFGATLVSLGLLFASIPGIGKHQINRFLFPSSDIPRYTGVEIELELESNSILYGQDVNVVARITQGEVDRLTLLTRTDDGQEATLPMLSQGDGRWQSILTRVIEPLDVLARSDLSRSRVHRLEVQLTPKILPPRVTIEPPTYTNRGTYRGGLPEQGILGLVGTKVDWEVASNRPLSEGRILLSYKDGSSEQIELKPQAADDGRMTLVTGSMELKRPGRFELSIVDIAGIESQETIDGAIVITADNRPIVRIVHPRRMSLATPDISLAVVVMAEDDYGISSLSLYRSLNGSTPRAVFADVDGTPRQQVQWQLPLFKFQVVPGDEITLFARAEDNDPAGAKGSESPITTIRIISVEEFQRMAVQRRGAESLQAKYQTSRRYFEQIAAALREVQEAAKELEANPDSAEAAEKLQEKLAAAQEIAEEAGQQIEELAQKAMPIDVDQALAKRLVEMSQQAKKISEQLGRMQQDQKEPLDQQELKKLEEMLRESKSTQQQLTDFAVNPLQQMQKILPLVIDQQRFVQITRQQRDLAERLKALHDSDAENPETERRVAELEAEQEQLRQALDSLLDDIERHAEELPEDPNVDELRKTALDFAGAVRDSQAQAEMALTQEEMLGGAFPDAQQSAARAADILESFLRECKGMGDGASSSCKAAFRPGSGGADLGNSIQQMLAMMGMKPGASAGGNPGTSFGWGAGGGFAQRFPGQQNVGMYGSLPLPQNQPRSGRGDRSSGGVAINRSMIENSSGNATNESVTLGEAGGQSLDTIPAQYRSQVAEYFQTLTDELGSLETDGEMSQ